MAQIIDLGRIRFYFKGVYNPATTYELNDVVKYGGSTYVYVNTTADSANLPTDTDFWAKMTDGIQYEDTYSPSTAYQENDIIIYGSQTYIALGDTTGIAPTNTAHWKLFAGGIGVRGDWVTATAYYPNDLVTRGATLYICTEAHTSSASFSTDSAKWDVFVTGINNRGTWTADTAYLKDDLVNDGVSVYTSLDDHTSGSISFISDSAHWELLVAGADYLPSQLGYANHLLATDGTDPYWTPNIDIQGAVISGTAYIGEGAVTFDTSAGLTDSVAVFNKTGGGTNSYAQIAFHNDEPTSSTDIIAYSSDGIDSEGWVDMGITGPDYTAAEFGITGPHDGYIFVNVPSGTTGSGNLVLATGANGTENNILIAAGGFDSGRTQMTIIPDNRVHIEIDTESTSPTTGALTVLGGAGILGNLNVQGNTGIVGNIDIQGSITVAGGQFVTENLSSTDPLLFVGNQNEGNTVDLGFMTEAKFSSTEKRFLFGTKSITSNIGTLVVAEYSVSVKSLTGNIATLTVGSHSFLIGDTITVTGVDATFNGEYIITATGATTISYAKTATDVVTAASSGTVKFRIVTGDRGNLIPGDFITISGAGAPFDGQKHLSSVTATTITFSITNANVPSTAISPAALGTRNTRSSYSGVVKDNTTGGWYLFSGLQVKPTTSVDFTLPELSFDDLTVGGITAKRGVNIFVDAAARDAAIPSPVHGTMVFRRDTNLQETYIDGKWDAVDMIHPFILMGV